MRERKRETCCFLKLVPKFIINDISFYQQLDVPHSVSKRYAHSLSVFIMSPHCVWIITVGGGVDKKTLVKFPNTVMLTELGKYKVMSGWLT